MKKKLLSLNLHKKIGLLAFGPIEKLKDSFATYHLRPRHAANIGTWSDKLKIEPKTAIVLQGPIARDHDFTLETVRLYRKLFPAALVIVSTWESEDAAQIESIRKEKVEVLLNKKPDFAGVSNINMQIVSARNGIMLAGKLGARYAMKTRTDQRMYAPNSLDFLRNLLKAFPLDPSIRAKGSIQKERIVGVSLNTFKYRPYGMSDMNIFGHIDDVLLYWNPPLDTRTIAPEKLARSTGEFAEQRVCEIYLATEFLKKVGHTPTMTVADSWLAFARHFCVADQSSLDLYWPKYYPHLEHRSLFYDAVRNSASMTFAEWLNIHMSLHDKADIPEQALDKNFGAAI